MESRIAVFVDNANLYMNGGFGMRYDVLRDFATRGGAIPVRLNCYVSYDGDRAESDPQYRYGHHGFCSSLRDFGFKVIEKKVKWYVDEKGQKFGKANADLDLAVDALLQSETVDQVLLATGDGDFVQVVRALQNRGSRVEVVAFENVSHDLRREADIFVSGYLIPNLLPFGRRDIGEKQWGQLGSTVRGVCYSRPPNKSFGFFRVMQKIGYEIYRTDPRHPDSPYLSVFCHDTNLPRDVNPYDLPSREMIFEFDIVEGLDAAKGFQAKNVSLVNIKRRPRADVAPIHADANSALVLVDSAEAL